MRQPRAFGVKDRSLLPMGVGMEIAYDESHTRLRVSDDGCGFDPGSFAEANGHYGLISMRERAEQVKGRVRIDSAPGRGTLVEAVVPTV